MPAETLASAAAITLAGVFPRSARLFADRVAVVGPDRRLTYRELDERSTRLANALTEAGIAPGERIAVLSNPRPEFVETYLAAAKLGVTIVALNTRLHREEIAYCIELARPRMLFAAADLRAKAGDASGLEDSIGLGDGYEQFLSAGASEDPGHEPAPEAIHNVLFTSGTTGRPKGAMISQRAAAIRAYRSAQWFGLGPDDGFVGWLPLFHCGGDEPLYATLLSGGRIATFERPDPEAMFAAIERERLTWTLLLPGVITDFLQHPRRSEFVVLRGPQEVPDQDGRRERIPGRGRGGHRRSSSARRGSRALRTRRTGLDAISSLSNARWRMLSSRSSAWRTATAPPPAASRSACHRAIVSARSSRSGSEPSCGAMWWP